MVVEGAKETLLYECLAIEIDFGFECIQRKTDLHIPSAVAQLEVHYETVDRAPEQEHHS